jgi:hypothetical protein
MFFTGIFAVYDREKLFLGKSVVMVIITLITATAVLPCVYSAASTTDNLTASAVNAQSKSTSNSSFLLYQNPDLGIKMQYPSSWKKVEDYLKFHAIVAFILTHTSINDKTNTTLAELDLRLYPVPANETSTKIPIRQLDTHNGSVLNSYTGTSGMRVTKIIDKIYGQEELQIWTLIPTKHILIELVYISGAKGFPQYLPMAKKMIASFEIENN